MWEVWYTHDGQMWFKARAYPMLDEALEHIRSKEMGDVLAHIEGWKLLWVATWPPLPSY